MADPQSTIDLINAVLTLLGHARGLFGAAERKLRLARLERFPTPRALQRAIVRSEVAFGQTVRVTGYVSRFAHLYRPISFVNVRLDAEKMASMVAVHQRKGMRVRWLSATRVAQNPIASLPPLVIDDERVRVLFLYPASHDTFLYSKLSDRNDQPDAIRFPDYLSPRVAIPQDAWPIPVLVPAEEAINIAESKVELFAVVRELPPDLAGRFTKIYENNYERSVLSNFLFLPGLTSRSYCLSMLPSEEDVGSSSLKEGMAANRALLYAEGHVEGSTDAATTGRLVSQSVPLDSRVGDLSVQSYGNGMMTSGIQIDDDTFILIAAPNDVSVMIKTPSIIGFYAETGPTHPLQERTTELAQVVDQFRRGLAAAATREGVDLSLKIDFLHDFERQGLFAPDGALDSGLALEALRGDPDLERTRDWLRASGGPP